MIRGFVVGSVAVALAAGVLPACAESSWDESSRLLYRRHDWHAVHRQIYEAHNRIALLEADPEIDADRKAQPITDARADMRRLNRSSPRPDWRWAVPCCYHRKPIHLR